MSLVMKGTSNEPSLHVFNGEPHVVMPADSDGDSEILGIQEAHQWLEDNQKVESGPGIDGCLSDPKTCLWCLVFDLLEGIR